MPVFNKETVLTAVMQAVQEFGYHHVGPAGKFTQASGEHCLVGEVLARTGADLGKKGGGDTSGEAIAILKASGAQIQDETQLQQLFVTMIQQQDKGTCWGEVLDSLY